MAEVQQIQFRSAQTPLGELATLPQTFYSAGEGATPPRLLSPSTPTAPRSLVRVPQFFFHNLSTRYTEMMYLDVDAAAGCADVALSYCIQPQAHSSQNILQRLMIDRILVLRGCELLVNRRCAVR